MRLVLAQAAAVCRWPLFAQAVAVGIWAASTAADVVLLIVSVIALPLSRLFFSSGRMNRLLGSFGALALALFGLIGPMIISSGPTKRSERPPKPLAIATPTPTPTPLAPAKPTLEADHTVAVGSGVSSMTAVGGDLWATADLGITRVAPTTVPASSDGVKIDRAISATKLIGGRGRLGLIGDGSFQFVDARELHVIGRTFTGQGDAGVLAFGAAWIVNEATSKIVRLTAKPATVTKIPSPAGLKDADADAEYVWAVTRKGVLSRVDPEHYQRTPERFDVSSGASLVASSGQFIWLYFRNDRKIVRFDPETEKSKEIADAKGITDLLYAHPYVWAVGEDTDKLLRIDTRGSSIESFSTEDFAAAPVALCVIRGRVYLLSAKERGVVPVRIVRR